MWKWEDENWEKVNLQANYNKNDRSYAEPYMIIPASKGKFHVYVEANGQMAVKSIGGKADGSWRGTIAYDTSRRAWNIGNYKGCIIENYKSSNSFVLGHPDAEINQCKFDSARGVECDWYASFQLTCDDDEAAWILYAPPIPKDSLYNYTVSYGEYTESYCEWGAVSISIDEDNTSTGNEVNFRTTKGEIEWSRPEPERQLVEQTQLGTPTSTNLVVAIREPSEAGSEHDEEDSSWKDLPSQHRLDPIDGWVETYANGFWERADWNNPVHISFYQSRLDSDQSARDTIKDISKQAVPGKVGALERFKLAGKEPIGSSNRTTKNWQPAPLLERRFGLVDPVKFLEQPEHFGTTPAQAEEFISFQRQNFQQDKPALDPMAQLEADLDELKPPSPPPPFNSTDGDPWEGVQIKPRVLKDPEKSSTLSKGSLKGILKKKR